MMVAMQRQTVRLHQATGFYRYTSGDGDLVVPVEGCTDTCEHLTREEAYEHHRLWLVSNSVARTLSNQQLRCARCGNWTSRIVGLGPTGAQQTTPLCGECGEDRSYFETKLPPGTKLDSWGSG